MIGRRVSPGIRQAGASHDALEWVAERDPCLPPPVGYPCLPPPVGPGLTGLHARTLAPRTHHRPTSQVARRPDPPVRFAVQGYGLRRGSGTEQRMLWGRADRAMVAPLSSAHDTCSILPAIVAVWLVVFALLGLPPVARGAGTAYVLTGDGDIAQYAIQADGQLSPLSAGIVNTGAGASDMAVTPDGRSAYVGGHEGVSQYDIDPATGALSPKSPALIPKPDDDLSQFALAVSPNGRSAYAIAGEPHGGTHINQYDIDPITGALAFRPGAGIPGSWLEALLISPDGRSAYMTDFSIVVQFDIDPISGQVSRKDPAMVSTGLFAGAAALSPDGKNVYVLNKGHGYDRIAQFDVDATTGKLSPKTSASLATGPNPVFIVVTPDSASAYVSSLGPRPPHPSPDPVGPGSIYQYDIDPATGALAPKSPPTVETGGNPASSAVTPDGGTAYVTEPRQGVVRLYDIDPQSGALTPKANSTITTGGSPRRIVLGPLPRVPTAKAHCQRSGWRDYGQFKNQGHCVAFVVRSGPEDRRR